MIRTIYHFDLQNSIVNNLATLGKCIVTSIILQMMEKTNLYATQLWVEKL